MHPAHHTSSSCFRSSKLLITIFTTGATQLHLRKALAMSAEGSDDSVPRLHEHSGAVSLGLALLCALGGYAHLEGIKLTGA